MATYSADIKPPEKVEVAVKSRGVPAEPPGREKRPTEIRGPVPLFGS
jgi:hypothetical protein